MSESTIEWNYERALQMREDGETWTEIGRRFGIDPGTARCRLDPDYQERRARQRRNRERGLTTSRYVFERIENVPPVPADTRGLTARTFGDPIFERSALYAKLYGSAAQ